MASTFILNRTSPAAEPVRAMTTAIQQGQPGFEPGTPYAQSYDARLDQLLGANAQIQLDASGLDEQYYRSLNALRSYANDALAQGIDVTGAPRPGYEQVDQPVIANFRRALEQHMRNRDALTQGKSILDQTRAAMIEGKLLYSPLNGQLMTADRFQQSFIPVTNDYIQRVNQVLTDPVQSQQDYAARMTYREEAVRNLNSLVENGALSREGADNLIAQIAVPGQYDSRLRDAQIAKLRADAAKARTEQRAKQREMTSIGAFVIPGFAGAVVRNDALRNSADANAKETARLDLSNSLSGTRFKNEEGYNFYDVRYDPVSGRGTIQYLVPENIDISIDQRTIKKVDASGRVTEEMAPVEQTSVQTIMQGGQRRQVIEVGFSRDNLNPVVQAIASEAESRNSFADLKEEGYVDQFNRITAKSAGSKVAQGGTSSEPDDFLGIRRPAAPAAPAAPGSGIINQYRQGRQ